MIEHYVPQDATIEITSKGRFRFPDDVKESTPASEEAARLEELGYTLDEMCRPLHPELTRVIGEHGLRLGRSHFWHKWGPNYTVDTVVMSDLNSSGPEKVLLIRRSDNGKLALPGGFIDEDEHPQAAAIRELQEETNLNVSHLKNMSIVYSGPVRDDRETIHAWPETTAYYSETHRDLPEISAGDDATEAEWHECAGLDLESLHGSHGLIITRTLAERAWRRRMNQYR